MCVCVHKIIYVYIFPVHRNVIRIFMYVNISSRNYIFEGPWLPTNRRGNHPAKESASHPASQASMDALNSPGLYVTNKRQQVFFLLCKHAWTQT